MMRRLSRPEEGTSRAQRGVTLVATVLLTLIAMTVVMVIVQQTLSAAASDAQRADTAVAQRVAADVVAQFEVELANDPTFYTRELFFAERPRMCAATGEPVAATGDPNGATVTWPAACGPNWQYLPIGDSALDYDPTQVISRAEISAPSASDPTLKLTVLASIGAVEQASVTRYQIPSAGQVTTYSGQPLNLDTLAGPSGTVRVAGTIYSPSAVSTPTRPEHTTTSEPLAGSEVLTECTISGPAAGALTLREAASVADRTAAGCATPQSEGTLDVRERSVNALTAADATRSLTTLVTMCPAANPALNAAGASTWLCLRTGTSIIASDGGLVPVNGPDGNPASAYRLMFLDLDGVASVQVDVASSALLDPASPAEAAASFAAGTHPLSPNGTAWVTLGTFALPATGVIVTDAATYVGQCPAHFAAEGCAANAPGAPVTVVAGTPNVPQDLIVAGPLTSTPATPLGLVASGRIDIPFYATTPEPGANLTLDAHLYAAANDTTTPSLTSRAGTQRGTLSVNGSLGATSLSDLAGWSAVHINATSATALPWYVTFTPYWRPVATGAVPSIDVCGELSCSTIW